MRARANEISPRKIVVLTQLKFDASKADKRTDRQTDTGGRVLRRVRNASLEIRRFLLADDVVDAVIVMAQGENERSRGEVRQA